MKGISGFCTHYTTLFDPAIFIHINISRFILPIRSYLTIPVAARSKAPVCGRSLTGIAGSNPAGGMDVCFL